MEEIKIELKHTPGQWSAEITPECIWVTGPDRNANVLCDIIGRVDQLDEGTQDYDNIPQEEDIANAKLMAAAPLLITALVDVLNAKTEQEYAASRNKAKLAIITATDLS